MQDAAPMTRAEPLGGDFNRALRGVHHLVLNTEDMKMTVDFYVGVLGNERLDVLPVWEMSFAHMPDNKWKIATERVKWSTQYQKKHGIMTDAAALDPGTNDRIHQIARRVYRALDLNGYARIDLRLTNEGDVYVLEANPNPNLKMASFFRAPVH